MNSIETLIKLIGDNSNSEERTVKGIWDVKCLYNPKGNGRIFDYRFLVSQTLGQGCAYSIKESYDVEYLKSIIGKDFLHCDITDSSLLLSLIDSIYDKLFPKIPYFTQTKDGASEDKMKWRTQIILDRTKALLGNDTNKKVLNIGVVGDFIREFERAGYDISGSDFDDDIVNTTMFDNAYIHHGNFTIDALKDKDLAIITGMTITTNTIDEITEYCNKNSIATIVFAETGSNLGGFYTSRGIDCYVGEEFPFYIFNGKSTINVHMR